MLLVLGDDRTDLDIPDLLPQRLRVRATQSLPATAASARPARNDGFAFGRRNESALKLLVTVLPSALPFRLCFLLGLRLRVRMFRRGRLRRISRRLIQPNLKRFDLRNQHANDRLRFWRLPSNQIFRDFKRHTRVVTNHGNQSHANSTGISIQAVNGYILRYHFASISPP